MLSSCCPKPVISPGVYNSITVLSPAGGARFEPGVYIIRGVSPLTQTPLTILGPVEAEGVMFYITDSSNYDPSTGLPDADDDSENPPPNPPEGLLPSALIMPLIPGGRISGLNDPSSPFHKMLIYQKPTDRRPIIIEANQLAGDGDIAGTIYAKWAHTTFVPSSGLYDLRFVTGAMRMITSGDSEMTPSEPLPPARDVLLVE